MGEYFHGRRRRFGVLMLVMALVTMGGWIRSRATSDFIRFFPVQFHGFLIVSVEQTILLQVWSGAQPELDEMKPRKRPRRKKPEYQPEQFGIHLNEELTKHVPLGSSVATIFQPESGQSKRYCEFSVPYWSFTVPLTLLSAFLLLSKPRKATSDKITEPIPEKVA